MARKKISELTELSAIVDDGDYLVVLDSSGGATKKIKISNVLGGWRDLRCPLVAAATGAGTPSLAVFGPTGNIKQRSFGVGDSVYLAGHWDHDIKVGSTVYPHVHWSTNGTDTGNVQWQMSITTAARTNQAAFPTDTVITVEEAATGTAWSHMVTEDATGFTAPEVDALSIIELKRIAASSDENTDTVFGLFVDFHYEAQQYGTPSRAPDFYS